VKWQPVGVPADPTDWGATYLARARDTLPSRVCSPTKPRDSAGFSEGRDAGRYWHASCPATRPVRCTSVVRPSGCHASRDPARTRRASGRLIGAALLLALWLGLSLVPTLARAQGGAPVSGLAHLALQPWHLFNWTRADDDDLGWTGRLSGDWGLLEPTLDGITWKSTFAERQAGAHDNRSLMTWQARAASPLWSGTLIGDVNLLALEPANAMGPGVEPRRWLRLAIKESWGPVALGVRFESISPGLDKVTSNPKGDTEGGEIWLEGREGPLRLRISGGQFWDNLDGYPWQPRTTKTQVGGSVEVSLVRSAALGLGYQNGVAERLPGPRPRKSAVMLPQTSEFQSVSGWLSRTGPGWTLAASTTYSPSVDIHNRDRETVSVSHDVSASFELLPSLHVTPGVSVGQDTYESGIRSQTTSASVSVSWTSILEGVDLTLWGSYARNRTSDDFADATAISAAANLVWQLWQIGPTRTSLALEAGSNHYFDAMSASARYGELYGMITLRIASF
jgi:hypothetical protein